MRLIRFCLLAMLITTAAASNVPINGFNYALMNSALHSPGVSKLPLRTIDGSHIRMTIFTTYTGYTVADQELQATIWATIEPELKSRCRTLVKSGKRISPIELNAWLARLLGLPIADAAERRFVVMDVPAIQAYYGSHPSQIGIFRPCTDPRIQTHTDGSAICPPQMNANDTNIASEFKTWFINNSITSFQRQNGMPWTEYGYTFNWNSDAQPMDGASEFVVLKNTPVTVLANPNNPATPYISAAEYCGLV